MAFDGDRVLRGFQLGCIGIFAANCLAGLLLVAASMVLPRPDYELTFRNEADVPVAVQSQLTDNAQDETPNESPRFSPGETRIVRLFYRSRGRRDVAYQLAARPLTGKTLPPPLFATFSDEQLQRLEEPSHLLYIRRRKDGRLEIR